MIRRSGDWLTAQVGDEVMMMSAAKGNYLGLNAVGARIWELLETPRDLDGLCGQLTEEFEIDAEQCRREVGAFVAEMEQHGAMAVDTP